MAKKIDKRKLNNPPLTVYPSADLNQWVRGFCKREGRTLTATVERALRAYKQLVEQHV